MERNEYNEEVVDVLEKALRDSFPIIISLITEENPEAYRVTEEMITELTEKLRNQNKERREQNN